jgi:cell wall-associated protease
MLKKSFFYCLILVLLQFIACLAQQKLNPSRLQTVSNTKQLPIEAIDSWQHLDPQIDSVFGISTDKAYKELIKNKKGKPIIVAVIDTELDINHEDLKGAIWINIKEITNNGVDDDKNGYIDDINGWNFLGNKKGESIIYSNLESKRILNYLSNKKILTNKDSLLFDKVKKIYEKEIESGKNIADKAQSLNERYLKALESVKSIFPKAYYNYEQIDSVLNITNKKEDQFYNELKALRYALKYNLSKDWFIDNLDNAIIQKTTTYNPNYYDKSITGDNENDINDKFYGNNNVYQNAKKVWHSTQVSGIIAANRNNDIGIKGFGNQIQIMPVVAICFGHENDKDIALAIRYAVDNGAQVINLSFGKGLSTHEDWVKDAIQYADKKNVLIVHSAGNDAQNTDKTPNFPINYDQETDEEFCSNFITVGGTSSDLKKMVFVGTNYGNHVDILAPSYELTVTDTKKNYTKNSGTSLGSAVVSGVAALVRSHYPKLSASQVKQIILDSGVSYDMEVIVPGTKDKKIKFSELSKSGKVVNVYNALLMAEKMSKKKK